MNLYLISQGDNNGYETYDSSVVASESEDKAKLIHPGNRGKDEGKLYAWNPEMRKWQYSYVGLYSGDARVADDGGQWANSPEGVDVELIGVAAEGTEEGVICASFNAG
jgi:hypothetical protein